MTGIQIIGVKPVIDRYEKLGCDAWALYQGKQFIVGGNSSDALSEWLKDFEASGSTAAYTLRVYDSDESPTSSTGNNDYIACFQFKVTDTYEGYGIAGHNNKLMERITGLENRIKELSKPDTDEDTEGSIGAVVSDWLQNPEKLAVVFGIAKQIFSGGSGYLPSAQPAAMQATPLQTISGMGTVQTKAVSASSPEGLERIAKALDILGEYDKDLVVHLEKLAKLAKDEPDLFKNVVISKLDLL